MHKLPQKGDKGPCRAASGALAVPLPGARVSGGRQPSLAPAWRTGRSRTRLKAGREAAARAETADRLVASNVVIVRFAMQMNVLGWFACSCKGLGGTYAILKSALIIGIGVPWWPHSWRSFPRTGVPFSLVPQETATSGAVWSDASELGVDTSINTAHKTPLRMHICVHTRRQCTAASTSGTLGPAMQTVWPS
jgi:hypothetical protein